MSRRQGFQREYLHPRQMQEEIQALSQEIEKLNRQGANKVKEIQRVRQQREQIEEETQRAKVELRTALQLVKVFTKEREESYRVDHPESPSFRTKRRLSSSSSTLFSSIGRLSEEEVAAIDPDVLDRYVSDAFETLIHSSNAPVTLPDALQVLSPKSTNQHGIETSNPSESSSSNENRATSPLAEICAAPATESNALDLFRKYMPK